MDDIPMDFINRTLSLLPYKQLYVMQSSLAETKRWNDRISHHLKRRNVAKIELLLHSGDVVGRFRRVMYCKEFWILHADKWRFESWDGEDRWFTFLGSVLIRGSPSSIDTPGPFVDMDRPYYQIPKSLALSLCRLPVDGDFRRRSDLEHRLVVADVNKDKNPLAGYLLNALQGTFAKVILRDVHGFPGQISCLLDRLSVHGIVEYVSIKNCDLHEEAMTSLARLYIYNGVDITLTGQDEALEMVLIEGIARLWKLGDRREVEGVLGRNCSIHKYKSGWKKVRELVKKHGGIDGSEQWYVSLADRTGSLVVRHENDVLHIELNGNCVCVDLVFGTEFGLVTK